MHRGYIKLWRKIEDSGMLQDPHLLSVWVYILTHATHQSHKTKFANQWVKLEPGQLITGRRKMAGLLGLGEQVVRRCLRDLGPDGLGAITSKPTRHGTLISVCKWSNYQGNGSTANPQGNPRPTHAQPTPNPPTTTIQECKNEKNGRMEGDRCPYSEMQEEWNRLCQESGMQKCRVFGDSAKQNAKNRWAQDWFRKHWREIFAVVHKQSWCIENHAGIDHPLRKQNAERYVNEVLDQMERTTDKTAEYENTRAYIEQQREQLRQKNTAPTGEKRGSAGGMKSLGDVLGEQ